MPRVTLSQEEFADFVILFLLDKMLNEDEVVTKNEAFNEIIDDMERKGLRTKFLAYFFDVDSNQRVDYKRIKKGFTNRSTTDTMILVSKTKTDLFENMLRYVIKKITGKNNINEEKFQQFKGLIEKEFLSEEEDE